MKVSLTVMPVTSAGRCILTFVLMLFTCVTSIYGQDKERVHEPVTFKYEVRAGWGGFPFVDRSIMVTDNSGIVPPDGSLSSLYRDYNGDTYMTGVFSAEFSFNFRKWFSLALGVDCDGIYTRRYSADTGHKTGTDRRAVLTFLPQARFSYLNREYVKLYSSIGLGYSFGTSYGDSVLFPSVQLTPIGVTAGKKVFGFFEIGVGTLYIGCMAGAGFRF